MSRFNDYLASAITPQMTLLEKFNALINFLKENNYISIFYSSENYNPTKENYQISNVSTLNYDLHLGDCVVFSNGYYAFVETLGENTFTIGNILYFQGEQGVSVVSASISNTGNLILNLSDGNTINAGNTGAVKDFIIDDNQHLIVRYLNGTQNDLGAIFNGNININGNFTANSIIENMTGYSIVPRTTANFSYNFIYGGLCKNGNKLTGVVFVEITKTASSGSFEALAYIYVPSEVGQKIYPFTIGSFDNIILSQKATAMSISTIGNFINVDVLMRKTGDTLSTLYIRIGDGELPVDEKCLLRFEWTFLLSDSLVS